VPVKKSTLLKVIAQNVIIMCRGFADEIGGGLSGSRRPAPRSKRRRLPRQAGRAAYANLTA
jgi:hypothetical protein